ncbi:MAG: hypothetical protein OXE50_07865 [Chloroflexi bacterium]|nr:hypothetical protein [Chloroflexota bacterium]
MADQEYDREMAEAIEHAEASEVVCIILPLINQCLVYDNRSTADDPPRIAVSPPLGSAERRLRHVNRARPNLPHARELAAIPWVGSIRSLEESGVCDMLYRRVYGSGFDSAQRQYNEALDELRQWERRSTIAMIRGQGPYHTLWSRSGN